MHSEDWISDLDEPDLDLGDLGDLIEQVTVDAYGVEGYWSFREAFEDHIDFPVAASVISADATVTAIDFDGDERRGLNASIERDGRTWTVSLLDIELSTDQGRFLRLTQAYRRWLGMDT